MPHHMMNNMMDLLGDRMMNTADQTDDRALMQMPEEKREILILSRFQELKYEEIARLLGCELGTVKTRIHRAIQELRQVFKQLERGLAPREARPAMVKNIPPRRAGNEM